MDKGSLTNLGDILDKAVKDLAVFDRNRSIPVRESTFHVHNVNNILLIAYEQLRNASENIESHLLFQRAIRRFYKRNLSFVFNKHPNHLAQELIIELTQAEYIENDTIALVKIEHIDALISELYRTYWSLANRKSVKKDDAQEWVLELLSVRTEQVLHNPIRLLSFANFAYNYFVDKVDISEFIVEGEIIDPADYPKLLYLSIHKALMKSDDANIRNALLGFYSVSTADIDSFIEFNKNYDKLAYSKTSAKVARLVNRNGAPLRVVRSAIFSESRDVSAVDISNKTKTLATINAQVEEDYQQVKKNLRSGVIKSIVFLLMTKAFIGLVIEIPYDILVYGTVLILPLVINLLFPPFFIALMAFTFKLPSSVNTKAITEFVDSMLYQGDIPPSVIKAGQIKGKSYVYNTVYSIVFIGVFLLVADTLSKLHFNIVQGVIFFIFLSTASFLGYRLTLRIKELEIINTSQGLISLVRDSLYAPFIYMGQKISYRFSKMNIAAQILDIAIELPLKTIFRLVRQWTIFLSNKRDELL